MKKSTRAWYSGTTDYCRMGFLQYFSFNWLKSFFQMRHSNSGLQSTSPVRSTNSLRKSSRAVSSTSRHTSHSLWAPASPSMTVFASPTSASTGERSRLVSPDYGTGSSVQDRRYLIRTSHHRVLCRWKSACKILGVGFVKWWRPVHVVTSCLTYCSL